MDLKNEVFTNYASSKLLKRFGKLAEYNRKSKDENRGKTLFGANAGLNFFFIYQIKNFDFFT